MTTTNNNNNNKATTKTSGSDQLLAICIDVSQTNTSYSSSVFCCSMIYHDIWRSCTSESVWKSGSQLRVALDSNHPLKKLNIQRKRPITGWPSWPKWSKIGVICYWDLTVPGSLHVDNTYLEPPKSDKTHTWNAKMTTGTLCSCKLS